MAIYLRDNVEGSEDSGIDIPTESSDLDEQLDLLLAWLKANSDFDFGVKDWIVNVGFSRRQVDNPENVVTTPVSDTKP